MMMMMMMPMKANKYYQFHVDLNVYFYIFEVLDSYEKDRNLAPNYHYCNYKYFDTLANRSLANKKNHKNKKNKRKNKGEK